MLEKSVVGLAVASLICAAGGPLLARFGVLPPMAGLVFFALGGVLGLGAMAAGATAAIEHKAYFAAMIGMLGSLPFVGLTAGIMEASRHPAINDITTDLTNPPLFQEAQRLPGNEGRDLSFPGDSADAIREHYRDVAPLRLEQGSEQAYRKALGIAASRAFRWKVTSKDPAAFRFEAVAETRLFHWKDDVVVRIQPDGEGGCVVDMRSKSREGKSDLGANARRIRKFLEALAN